MRLMFRKKNRRSPDAEMSVRITRGVNIEKEEKNYFLGNITEPPLIFADSISPEIIAVLRSSPMKTRVFFFFISFSVSPISVRVIRAPAFWRRNLFPGLSARWRNHFTRYISYGSSANTPSSFCVSYSP